jgi:predicted kinase
MSTARPGWNPAKLREYRESHNLSLQATGEELRRIAARYRLPAMAANFQTLAGHETGKIYPGPPYRRAYCLLYDATEWELGFRLPLPSESTSARRDAPAPDDEGRAVVSAGFEGMVDSSSSESLWKELVGRVLAAWADRRVDGVWNKPTLVMVGGYAGSGKTEFARFLSRLTGWALLDKDKLSRPLAEGMLVALGQEPTDRQSEVYLKKVRPLEYRCLFDAAYDNIDRGVSVVVSAPLLSEYRDSEWLQRLAHRCAGRDAVVIPLWVKCDTDSMLDYLTFRGAGRDTWKVTHWADYLESIDLNLRPVGEHVVIDNMHGSAVSAADRVRGRLSPATGEAL